MKSVALHAVFWSLGCTLSTASDTCAHWESDEVTMLQGGLRANQQAGEHAAQVQITSRSKEFAAKSVHLASPSKELQAKKVRVDSMVQGGSRANRRVQVKSRRKEFAAKNMHVKSRLSKEFAARKVRVNSTSEWGPVGWTWSQSGEDYTKCSESSAMGDDLWVDTLDDCLAAAEDHGLTWVSYRSDAASDDQYKCRAFETCTPSEGTSNAWNVYHCTDDFCSVMEAGSYNDWVRSEGLNTYCFDLEPIQYLTYFYVDSFFDCLDEVWNVGATWASYSPLERVSGQYLCLAHRDSGETSDEYACDIQSGASYWGSSDWTLWFDPISGEEEEDGLYVHCADTLCDHTDSHWDTLTMDEITITECEDIASGRDYNYYNFLVDDDSREELGTCVMSDYCSPLSTTDAWTVYGQNCAEQRDSQCISDIAYHSGNLIWTIDNTWWISTADQCNLECSVWPNTCTHWDWDLSGQVCRLYDSMGSDGAVADTAYMGGQGGCTM